MSGQPRGKLAWNWTRPTNACWRPCRRTPTPPPTQLAEKINLSPSQAGRRRQRIEASGLIKGYTARLDPARLGLTVQAFVQVEMVKPRAGDTGQQGSRGWSRPSAQIVGAWTMTGAADYLLRVSGAPTLAALNTPGASRSCWRTRRSLRVHSQIVMNQLKTDAPLPT